MNDYIYKFNSFVKSQIADLRNINIVEFGVKEGRSTKIFLDLCKKNSSKLYSVDVDDYSYKFQDHNWTFVQSRDDNFEFLETKLPKKVDVIYIDSLHEAEHVKKLFYHYFNKLNVNGFMFIDDISWLPYLKNKLRNNFYCEINNLETFKMILEIYDTNTENFELSFDFTSSGICKILKKRDTLNLSKKIISRENSFKNTLRKILKIIKK